jgi:AraC-like DNA-binding protein
MSATATLHRPELDFYLRQVHESFLNIDLRFSQEQPGFSADFMKRSVGPILATMARTNGVQGVLSARRERRHILAEHDDSMVFLLVRSGIVRHTQFGTTAVTAPGFALLIDSMEPYHVEHSGPASSLHFRIPRSLLKSALGVPERSCGFAIDARNGINAIARDTLLSIWRHAGDLDAVEETETTQRVIDAVARMSASHSRRRVVPDTLTTHFQRAHNHIAAHLDDPTLSPGRIAEALRLSVGHLHSVMRSQGVTVERLITSLRLDKARDALADPRQRDRTIGRIALDWGFADGAHFSRAFKSKFHQTPRQFRRVAAGNAAPQHH